MTTTEEQPREAMAAQIEALAEKARELAQGQHDIAQGGELRGFTDKHNNAHRIAGELDDFAGLLDELAIVTALRQAEVKDQRYSFGHCKDCPGDHSRMCCQNQTSDGSSVPPLRQAEAAPARDYTAEKSARWARREAIPEEMIDLVLNAQVPGGSTVADWLPQEDAWTPHQTALDIARSILHAIAEYRLNASPIEVERTVADSALVGVEAMRARLLECGPANFHNGTDWVGKPYNRDGVEAAAMLLALASRQHAGVVERYRHVDNGTVYGMIGTAELQAEQPQHEHAQLAIYRGENGKLWARNTGEFHDGRFVAAPATDEGELG